MMVPLLEKVWCSECGRPVFRNGAGVVLMHTRFKEVPGSPEGRTMVICDASNKVDRLARPA